MTTASARLIRIVAFASVTMCSGCIIPVTDMVSPPIDGSVLDIETHRPIANAKITIHAGDPPKYDDGPITTVHSDAVGHFTAPAKMGRIWMPPLPYDRIGPFAKLSISAAGYEPQDVKWNWNAPSLIYLKHEN